MFNGTKSILTKVATRLICLCLQKASNGEYKIQDPQEKGKILLRTFDFEEAKFWLAENGYVPVDGRMVE